MFKLFNKKRGKKGFTLAELLVVVAIIAILVAIAIPIFTGALDRAEQAVKQADIRSVKAAAVTEILSDWNKYGYHKAGDVTSTKETAWQATADVAKNGDITKISIKKLNGKQLAATAEKAERQTDETYKVTVGINSLTATNEN